MTTVTIPDKYAAQIDSYAAATGGTRQAVIERALQEFFAKEELNPPSEAITRIRQEHIILLKNACDFDAIASFLERTARAGKLLSCPGERQYAQVLLDYWENSLYRAGVSPGIVSLENYEKLP